MNLNLHVFSASSKRLILCLKTFLCIYNLIFLILGMFLVVLGLVGMIYMQSLVQLANVGLYVEIVFIVTGVALFGFGLLGILAAITSSILMLKLYSVCLTLLFLVELASGIVGYVYRTELQNILGRAFNEAQHEYTGSNPSSTVIDTVQSTLGCCGFKRFSDWETTPYFKTSGIPVSCCAKKDECSPLVLKNLAMAGTQVHKVGCFTLLSQLLTRYVGAVAGAAIGIGFFQLIGITLACCLSRNLTHSFMGMPR